MAEHRNTTTASASCRNRPRPQHKRKCTRVDSHGAPRNSHAYRPRGAGRQGTSSRWQLSEAHGLKPVRSGTTPWGTRMSVRAEAQRSANAGTSQGGGPHLIRQAGHEHGASKEPEAPHARGRACVACGGSVCFGDHDVLQATIGGAHEQDVTPTSGGKGYQLLVRSDAGQAECGRHMRQRCGSRGGGGGLRLRCAERLHSPMGPRRH